MEIFESGKMRVKRKAFMSGNVDKGFCIWTVITDRTRYGFGSIYHSAWVYCNEDGIAIDSNECDVSTSPIDFEALPMLLKAIKKCRVHSQILRESKQHANLQKLANWKTPPEKVPELM